ncbi:MAG: hypothetical protein ACRECH_05970 [Nitrososphaerales archaeon]
MLLTLRVKIISILLVGSFVREIFAPFTGHPFDFEIWIRLGFYTALGQDPYRIMPPVPNLSMPGSGPLPSIGYPPAWPFLLAGIYKLYAAIGPDNRFLYYFLLKQPMILSDLLDGLLIYKIVKMFSDNGRAFRALAFWLLCPFTIIISSVWGMFDQIILALVLLSVLLLSRTATSALSETLGILLKAIPLIYLPVLAFVQRTMPKKIEYLVVSIGISILFTLLPYLIFPSWNISALLGTGSSTVHKVGNSMNYWVVLYATSNLGTVPSQAFPTLDLLSYVWIPAVIIASIFCVRSFSQGSSDRKNIPLALLFVTLTFYLTRSQINEQYLIYFLGFGLVDYYVLASRTRKKIFHAIWIDALAFLIANNSFLVRFLDPISISYLNLDMSLTTGFTGDVIIAITVATGIVFSVLCAIYLSSLYTDIRAMKKEAMIR